MYDFYKMIFIILINHENHFIKFPQEIMLISITKIFTSLRGKITLLV